MDKGGTKKLAIAIVLRALEDYEAATEVLKKRPRDEKAKAQILEIEEFFESAWFQTLRAIAPEIKSNILEEFKNDRKRISATSLST